MLLFHEYPNSYHLHLHGAALLPRCDVDPSLFPSCLQAYSHQSVLVYFYFSRQSSLAVSASERTKVSLLITDQARLIKLSTINVLALPLPSF